VTSDQKTIFGLFVAVVGLFLVWLWSTGRAALVWQDLWTGSNQSSFGQTQGAQGAASQGSNSNPLTLASLGNIFQGGTSPNAGGGINAPVGTTDDADESMGANNSGLAGPDLLSQGYGGGGVTTTGAYGSTMASGAYQAPGAPSYVAPSIISPPTSPFSFTGYSVPSSFGGLRLLPAGVNV
jgi:hypothetical protein